MGNAENVVLRCQAINQIFEQLSNLLIEKLHNCYVTKTTDKSFTELINAVNEIKAVEVENTNNIKPTSMPPIDNSNVSNFYISLYARTRYYMRLLGYFLVLKGVPIHEVNAQTDLKGLIELIDLIDVIKPSFLTVAPVDETQYFGVNIVTNYTLVDIDGEKITDGYISIKDSNDTEYAPIKTGQPITITPLRISEQVNGEYEYEIFYITYDGNDKYTQSNTETIQVKILPSKMKLTTDIKNITTKSKYYKNTTIGYEYDIWNLDIFTHNYQNYPLDKIPIIITIKDKDGNVVNDDVISGYEQEINGESDNKGHYSLVIFFKQTGTYSVNIKTNYEDTSKISNAEQNHTLNIKYNIIQQVQKEYTDYAGKKNYTYTINIVDEDTGQPTTAYNNYQVRVFVDDVEAPSRSPIINSQASYQLTRLPQGDKKIKWRLEYDNFVAESITDIHILSNFILPDKENYFLTLTPTIIYAPDGITSANNYVSVVIEYEPFDGVVVYEMERYIVDGQYEEDEEGNQILDENGNPIPVYDERYKLDEEGNKIIISHYTDAIDKALSDANGVIQGIENKLKKNGNYYRTGKYVLRLTTPIDIVEEDSEFIEEAAFHYTLTQPFDMEAGIYQKSASAQYIITLYDTEDEYNITISNENNGIISPDIYHPVLILPEEATEIENNNQKAYPYITLTVPVQNETTGNNTIQVTQNGYTQTSTFKLVPKVFDLLTESVMVGEGILRIRCYDSNITSIDIQPATQEPTGEEEPEEEIEQNIIIESDILFEDGVFTVPATFNKTGEITFQIIGDDGTVEIFTITVNKYDLTPYIEADVVVTQPTDNRVHPNAIAIQDIGNAHIFFNIDTILYSELKNIQYAIKIDNHLLHQQTFSYNQEDYQDPMLTIPTNLNPGVYTINFIYQGNDHYKPFNFVKNLTILRNTPSLRIGTRYTSFTDVGFFSQILQFSEANPIDVTSFSNNSYNTQSNNTWTSIGYYLTHGWANTGLWTCEFDVETNDLPYIKFHLLMTTRLSAQALLTAVNGKIASNPVGTYTRNNDSTLQITSNSSTNSWCHICMQKTSPTTLTITKTGDRANNGSVTYEWKELSNYSKFTLGAETNGSNGKYLKIKNFTVRGVN